MEELFIFPLLSSVGFDVRTDFSNTLDALFLNDPDNAALLELEMMKCKDAIAHAAYLMEITNAMDIPKFGKALMREIRRLYTKCGDLTAFSWKMYELWTSLPVSIAHDDPFFGLDYAVDCLSYGDEQQCRDILECSMNYYEHE